ncbi:hypothetical protein DL96DRAFT_1789145 [Flagelloscypha sp. PMI_526]|nr:hypothetical protein DL96DRAFT_1789145 [Flagelloscypha sp. PMI_526]
MTGLISPQSREAPRLKKDETSELLRFLDRYEDELKKASVTDDAEKIKNVGRFADSHLEREWQAFESYKSNNWEEFKTELKKNYPEALHDVRGAVEGLTKLSHRYNGINGYSKTTLATLLASLSEPFREKILSRLQTQREVKRHTNNSTTPSDEWFKVEEVIEMAYQLSDEQSGFEAILNLNKEETRFVPGRLTSDISPIRPLVKVDAKDTDALKAMERQQVHTAEEVKGQVSQLYKNQGSSATHYHNPMNQTYRPPPEDCYYCGDKSHMMGNCPAKMEDMQAGLIRLNRDQRLVLADGSPIPRGLPIRTAVKRKSPQESMLNEILFEDEVPQRTYTQFYQAPIGAGTLETSRKDERIDKLAENVEKLTSMMNTFMMGAMLHTRQKEYDGSPSSSN